jgi:hypothetical protein
MGSLLSRNAPQSVLDSFTMANLWWSVDHQKKYFGKARIDVLPKPRQIKAGAIFTVGKHENTKTMFSPFSSSRFNQR